MTTKDKAYKPSPSSGSLAVDGASVSESVAFSLIKYTAYFPALFLISNTVAPTTAATITPIIM